MTVDAEVAAQLEKIVLAKIQAGSLALPVLPVAATQALQLLRDPDVSLRAVAQVLDRDPMLTVQVLRAANSAAMGGAAVSTVEQALTRLGIVRMRQVVLEACARRMFQSRDSRIQKACEGIWEHSVAVAILARDLVALSGGAGAAETAYLAGLLHDVGKPIVAAYLLEAERLAAMRNMRWMRADPWIDIVNRVSRPVSVALVERWDLPATVVESIKSLADYDPANRSSPSNYVRFANALAKQQGIYVGGVDEDGAGALVMIGRSLLSLDDELVQRVTNDLQERARKKVA